MTQGDAGLLACPFCGSKNVDPEGWSTLPQYAETPEERNGPACDDCGASAATIKIWNTRALPPEAEQTAAGVINWKMEAERANRLLAATEERLSSAEPVAWRWKYHEDETWQHCSAKYTPPREAISEPLGVLAPSARSRK